MKRSRGYTMMEMVVAMAIFGVLLLIMAVLTSEMRANEKRYPINYMAHPEVDAVIARLRKDVYDTTYYPGPVQGYNQTPQTLILYTLKQTGGGETVVWDFRKAGEAERKAFVANQLSTDWTAHGVPQFVVDSFDLDTGQTAVRITATDDQKRLAIDQIFVPRPHD